MILIFIANLLARLSVDRWNKIRVLRGICRKAYQGMGEIYLWWRRVRPQKKPFGMADSWWEFIQNTYPWPYVSEDFANWPEEAITGRYTLISDPSGFVVKHCTSYCAWKIRELTGQWLPHPHDGKIYHAKDWQSYLALNGYDQVLPQPVQDCRAVGIIPDEGEFGQVLWYERSFTSMIDDEFAGHLCSTYTDHKHALRWVPEGDKNVIWIGIS